MVAVKIVVPGDGMRGRGAWLDPIELNILQDYTQEAGPGGGPGSPAAWLRGLTAAYKRCLEVVFDERAPGVSASIVLTCIFLMVVG